MAIFQCSVLFLVVVTILVGQTVYLLPVDQRCERCRLSSFLLVVLLSRKAVACWSHGEVADVLEIAGSNQRLTPFWSSLRAKFSVSRDCTFDQSTLPYSEAKCVKAPRLASTFLNLSETRSCDSYVRVVKINTV
jgi:hypothetical protein